MKHEYFTWNGIRSTAYGVYVSEQPPIMIPNERIEFEDIAGKAGSVAITEGEKVYHDIKLPVVCWANSAAEVRRFVQHIRGAGKIEFPNIPEGYYKGRLEQAVEIKRWKKTDVREFSMTFRCEPYIYIHGNHDITLRTPGYVRNHFNEDALPIFNISGRGDLALSVNGRLITLSNIAGSITLNSAIEEAYNGTVSLNTQVSGEFPRLAPGENAISWTGNISSIVITPNWRMT